ncbi:MAG: hypothetical protein E6K18_03480 [Methanobacteriota archaeon]|nr:MAG: hypothetical protein E6K18_03480 [Euryarchaeota archaeon]
MKHLISREELKSRLRTAPDQTQYRLYFAAILADAAAIPTDDFIVVGGSAIEIYTVGEYTSGDIDIVSSEHDNLRTVMRSWGFKRDGSVWTDEELGLVVDLNPSPYTGDIQKTSVMPTPFGSIRLAAIEDLLVKRLASAKFWKVRGDFDHAKLLAVAFRDRIDWEYVQAFAQKSKVDDWLARLLEAMDRDRPR